MSSLVGYVDCARYALLAAAAAGGGALNSIAGGGSFLTFPALLLAGVPPIAANATSALALWPGSVASAVAYRAELSTSRRALFRLGAVSVLGGLSGAIVLLRTSSTTFVALLPYLLSAAALVFTFGPRVARAPGAGRSRPPGPALLAIQFFIAFYGGYFGGGMGIVMLAAFSFMNMGDLHVKNALKVLLAALINLVAIVTFVAGGAIALRPAAVMIASGTLGGYYGARTARQFSSDAVRRVVLCVAWTLSIYFFVHGQGV